MSTGAKPIQVQARRNKPPYTFVVAVVAVSVVGTYLSTSLYSPATLSFRSRLPASAITALSNSDTDLDVPYFGDKRNIFNRLFVKYAWAWSLALALSHLVTRELFPAQPDAAGALSTTANGPSRATTTDNIDTGKASKRILVDALRWSTASFWWYFLTQRTWFFGTGPSLSHRLLVLTGAQCVPHAHVTSPDQSPAAATPPTRSPNPIDAQIEKASLGQTRCANGMHFQGGHDVSGHTFLLVLSSLLLFETVRSSVRQFRQGYALPLPHFVTMVASLALIALWIAMLAATSLFFHSPAEKMSGLAFGLAAWWASRGGKSGW